MQPLIMLLGHIVCYAYSEASTVGSRSDEEVTPCRCEAIRNSHTGESQLVLGQIETYANVLNLAPLRVQSARRARVFISSRQDEFEDERAYIKQRLADKGIDSFVFEIDARTSPASPHEMYLAEVAASDIYVGLFYKHYSQATMDEYNLAYNLDIPCLIYLKDIGRCRRSPALRAFLNRLRDRHVYQQFFKVTDLDVVCDDVLFVLATALRSLRCQRSSIQSHAQNQGLLEASHS